jgi:c-di-GMP-binding flagellar brake protein YcgR
MKKIIIIENGNVEQDSMSGILGQYSENYELLYTEAKKAAFIIAKQTNAELIIYILSASQQEQLDNLTRITTLFPYIPCIAIIGEEGIHTQAALDSGSSLCLAHPLKPDELHRHISEQLELATSGHVRGISIHSLLQMLESEEKTCTLEIQTKKRTGLIFVENGVVVGAETGDQENEDAVYAIIAWEGASVGIRYYNGKRPQTIQKPLLSLIMEGLRLKDERNNLKEERESEQKPKLELKQISTGGNRITLDIGSRIKMEFDQVDTPLISTMVGMIPDEYLLVTTPTPLSTVQTALDSDSKITITYLNMGRLYMFKTKLQKAIDDPRHLLFLDYPSVLHYHEMRRTKRTSVLIPCTLHLSRGSKFYGVLIDLSGLGCLCQIKVKGNAPLPSIGIDTTVYLHCLLPGLKEGQELTGTVKNFKMSSTEAHLGIAFSGLQNYLRKIIERYISSLENIMR